MPFSALIGNERIKALLKRAVVEGRIGQGLIMAGPRGVGKYQFALALAQALNCQQPEAGDACGQCLACRKIALGQHPDVQTILPDGQFIRIGQMRQVRREAQLRPTEGRRLVLIIDEAERLREEAANSILKTLEEPPASSLILLITSKPYALLETIRSRCQMLSFAPLTTAELEQYLSASYKRPAEEIKLLARLACGQIGRALEIDLGEYRDKRKLMIEILEALTTARDSLRLIEAAEYLGRKLERDQFTDHIEILMTLLSDIFHLKLGLSGNGLTNADIASKLEQVASAFSLEQIIELVDRIEQLLEALPRNINRQLAMESLLLTSQEALSQND
jgi:DNA polymerase-3 subunit delta'